MENNVHPLDPSHELPAGDNDDIMAGSIYAGMEQWQAQREAAAEQQAIVDAAHEEAEQSPRLSQEERAYFRAIAHAANTAELPEGIDEGARLSTIPLRSTPAQAKAALEALKQDARDRLNASRKDYLEEKRAIRQREADEKAARDAAEATRLREEADARQAKLDAEADRVRNESRAAVTEEQKKQLVDAQVEEDLATKHGELSEQAKGIMRHGLRERYTQEADAHFDKMVEDAVRRRVKYIEENGGADAIDEIRAKEAIAAKAASDEQEARLAAEAEAEAAQIAEEADKANRKAFVDRLHDRNASRGAAFREAKDKQDAERNPRQPETPYLSTEERARLTAIANAENTSELPDDLSAEERRSLNNLEVGQNIAAMNFNGMRRRAEERLTQEEEARAALVDRVRDEGLGGFTDEEIANLPPAAMEEMNERDRREYFDRMHQIRGAEHQAAEHGYRNLVGVQSFSGEASELAADLAHQRSFFPEQAAEAPEAPVAPEQRGLLPDLDQGETDAEREQRYSDLYELELVDRDEWRRQLNELSDEDRDAYYAYGMNRAAEESNTSGLPFTPRTPEGRPSIWLDEDDDDSHSGLPPARAVRTPRLARSPIGGADPFAPMPARARSGADGRDPSDVAPYVPEIESGRGPWPKGFFPKVGRALKVATDWWPGRSAQSYLPNTRPSALRGSRRGVADTFRAAYRSMNTSPEPSDEERAQAAAYISERDRRDAEEAAAASAPAARARTSRPRVNRPGASRGTNPLDEL